MATVLACGATIANPGDLPGALITGPRQIEYNGLLMGSGTPIRWKTLTGWDGQPPVDLTDTPSPTSHGDIPGRGLFQPRIVTWEFFTEADTVPLMEELQQLLQDRFLYSDVERPLYVADSARTLWAYARVLQSDVPMDKLRTIGRTDQAVQWKSSLPLRYAPEVRTLTLRPAAAAATTGVSYPLDYPLQYGPIGSSSSTGVVVNDGNTAAPSVVEFHGPAGPGYGVTLAGVGQMLFGLPLAASDRLSVDTRDGSVVLNGTSDRDTALTDDSLPPEDWLIPPKASTSVGLVAPTGTGDATRVTLTWADTNR